MAVQQFEKVKARFEPRRVDDLRPGTKEFMGPVLEWETSWRITPEDGGDYVGEWAMSLTTRCLYSLPVHPPFAWVPSGDLVDEKGNRLT
jgi:hypothetical protein